MPHAPEPGAVPVAGSLLRWYRRHGRALPWRATRDPYRILLSETMLQQTQVQRALAAYPRFLRRFPSLRSLARAPLRDVLIAWRGMGYNNRAVRLHALARHVRANGGRLPRTVPELQALPGIGRYTAHAVLAFAFGHHLPVVDVNVRRVLSRLFWTMPSPSALQPEAAVWEHAAALLPRKRAYDWNQALMDLGALVCTARRPRCTECPVAALCRSRPHMDRAAPVPVKREPSFRGVPRRIYRGRILEALRALPPGTSMASHELGRRVIRGFSARNARWLDSLLQAMARDGLLQLKRDGSPHGARARLAS